MSASAKGRWGGGTLLIVTDSQGRRSYVGKVYVNGKQTKRRLGAVRDEGTDDGLTKSEATTALSELHRSVGATVQIDERLTVAEAGDLYLNHLEVVKGRKATTLEDYRQMLNGHLVPFLAGRSVDRVAPSDIAAYVSAKMREGLAPKTVRNHATFASGLFSFAVRKGWATVNPVQHEDLPVVPHDTEIHFLDHEEMEALFRAADGGDALGPTDLVLYLTAATTGLRMGELLALQWKDVDWAAGSIRVRRSYTRGAFSTPKSAKSSRVVPLTDRLAGALERHHQRSAFQGAGDLVFPHPTSGDVIDSSAMRRRFHAALARAGVRRVRFHDLRHSFGTAMAAAGCPMRALMAMMGHASMQTTLRYADYAPDPTGGAVWAQRAFGEALQGTLRGTQLSETQVISEN